MSDEEHQFESKADAGASKTFPQQAGTIRKNGYLVIKGRPCKVSHYNFLSFYFMEGIDSFFSLKSQLLWFRFYFLDKMLVSIIVGLMPNCCCRAPRFTNMHCVNKRVVEFFRLKLGFNHCSCLFVFSSFLYDLGI